MNVFELRQYTLHPGARDTLVRVFEQHFIEGQERCGMRILGQFRDLDNPDRFVWIRGFPDMGTRTQALESFYTGPVWAEHAAVANATMVDHTNVLLLRPAGPGLGFRFDPRRRPPPEAAEQPGGIVVATIIHLADQAPADDLGSVGAASDHEGAASLARLVTEPAPNSYPRLPVREDANVIVTLAAYPSGEARRPPALVSAAVARVERLRLAPTRRSFLRYPPLL